LNIKDKTIIQSGTKFHVTLLSEVLTIFSEYPSWLFKFYHELNGNWFLKSRKTEVGRPKNVLIWDLTL